MLILSDYVFLHLPKTGGQFIRSVLAQYKLHSYYYHCSDILLPTEFFHLPRLGFIRNPHDWYLDWYYFYKNKPYNFSLFNVASNNGSLSYNDTIERLFEIKHNIKLQQKTIKQTYNNLTHHAFLGYPPSVIERFIQDGDGLLTTLFHYYYSEYSQTPQKYVIGKTEKIRTDLSDFLENVIKIPSTDGIFTQLFGKPPVNVTYLDKSVPSVNTNNILKIHDSYIINKFYAE